MRMENVQPIEGITPGMLWTFIVVLVGLAALFVLGHKVVEIIRTERERKQLQQQPGEKLAEEISDKVLKKLEPRFADIDRKFANDKETIDRHTRQIEALTGRADSNDEGIKALSRGVLALLNHALHNGNTDELEKAQQGINDYLIEK